MTREIKRYIIFNRIDDEIVYWSNELGWIDFHNATLFESPYESWPMEALGWKEVVINTPIIFSGIWCRGKLIGIDI